MPADLRGVGGGEARLGEVWSAIGALALAVGPLLGGVLSQHASWSWIFFVNVPVGVVTIVLAQTVVTESTAQETRRLDLPGLILSAGGLTALTWALIEGGTRGWTSAPILGAFALAVAGIAAFAAVEARSEEPMVDVALFRDRVFTGGIVALMLCAFGLFGIYFFTSLYLQDVLRFSPTKAGVAFVPLAASLVVGAIASEPLAARFAAYRLVGGALLAMGIGVASVALLGASAHLIDLMPSFVVIGAAAGLTTPLTSSVLSAMPPQRVGVVSGVFNASRELAGLLGITVIGAIIAIRAPGSLSRASRLTVPLEVARTSHPTVSANAPRRPVSLSMSPAPCRGRTAAAVRAEGERSGRPRGASGRPADRPPHAPTA